MEHRRADADQHHGNQDHAIAAGDAEQHQADQGHDHAHRQRIGPGLQIRVITDRRLQQGCGDLIDQGDHADLGEAEMKVRLERWIDGGQQGLHHVVQQMAEADREQHREGGVVDGLAGGGGVCHGGGKMPCNVGFGHPLKRNPAFQGSGGNGVQRTSSIWGAPAVSITSRSKPSATPEAGGICAKAARKSSSRG